MQVTWLYTGEDGRSHFEELEVPLQFAGHGADSAGIASTTTVLSEVPEGASLGFHPAKRRQLIIYLSGLVEMECGDGSIRRELAQRLRGSSRSVKKIQSIVGFHLQVSM